MTLLCKKTRFYNLLRTLTSRALQDPLGRTSSHKKRYHTHKNHKSQSRVLIVVVALTVVKTKKKRTTTTSNNNNNNKKNKRSTRDDAKACVAAANQPSVQVSRGAPTNRDHRLKRARRVLGPARKLSGRRAAARYHGHRRRNTRTQPD